MPDTPAVELSSIKFESVLGGPLVAVVNAQTQAAMASVNFIKEVGFKRATSGDLRSPETGEPIYVKFKYPKETQPFQPLKPARISAIVVSDGGSGYLTAPDITFTGGGGGKGLKAKATVTAAGVVSEIEITNPGSEYTSAPTVVIPPPPTAAAGAPANTPAIATATFKAEEKAIPAQFADMILEVPILTMLPIPFIRIEETTIDFNVKINSVEEAKTDESFKFDAGLESEFKYPPAASIVTVKLNVSTSYQKTTQSGSKVDRTYSMEVHIRAVQDEMPAGMERILGILEDAIKARPLIIKK